ncbi:MAG: SURF1 family protein [Hyphomicrobiaceae bacterium]
MMLSRMRQAGLVWPTLLALAGLAVLIGLGNWQMQRKAWKDGLIAGVERGAAQAPIEFQDWAETARSSTDEAGRHALTGPEFVRVRARGRFLHDREAYFYTVRDGQPGYNVFTPLRMPNGQTVLVNRGFVPDGLRDPAKRPGSRPEGEVEVRGLTRSWTEPGFFTPSFDSGRRISYGGTPTIDPMGSADAPVGVYIEAEPAAEAATLPRGRSAADLLKIIPNRHLEYALTWYGIACTLIGVFAAFAIGRLKNAPHA